MPRPYAGRMPESPFDQSRYQVRHEWGVAGLARLARADVVVVVDVLRFSTTVGDAVARGERVPLDASAHAVSLNGAAVAAAAEASGALVMLGSLRNASAVAAAVLAEQERRGDRTSVAVIAGGELAALRQAQGPSGAALRFAVEDHLGAGAIIDALGELGIDHTSPEAAAACEAFRGLRGAVRHLLTASGSGQELIVAGRRDEVLAAAEVDAVDVVPVLREGAFVASTSMLIEVREERFHVDARVQPDGRRSYDFTWLNGPGDPPYGFTVGSTARHSDSRSGMTRLELEQVAEQFIRSFFSEDGIGPSDFPAFVAERRARP